MAKKPTVTTISAGFASNTQLNGNFAAVRDAFDNTLSLDGSTPNAMQADIDLNGNDIVGAGVVNTAVLRVGGVVVNPTSANTLTLVDGVTTPATITGYATIYIDSVDGDLKIKFGDGTVKTISTDT